MVSVHKAKKSLRERQFSQTAKENYRLIITYFQGVETINWTNEEILYLEENWSYKTVKAIAKKLNRTEEAVILKSKRLQMGSPYNAGEFISAHQAANILGVDVHAITDRWIANHGLKARKVAMRSQPMWRIKLINLIKWLRDNPDKWNASRVELYALGPEPTWLREKRRSDALIPPKRFVIWDEESDKMLIAFYRSGLAQSKIGERMGRSEVSIQRRISRLKERGLLTKCKIIIYWSEREEEEFKKLEAQRLSDTEIAFELGREREHIVDHRRCLRERGLYIGRK